MNILFLLRLWPVYGGGETVTICLANEMIKRGWHVGVAFFQKSMKDNLPYIDPKIRTIKIDNVRCDEFNASRKDSNYVQDMIISYIINEHVDVVINQWWPSYYIDRLKDETSAKIITCSHQAFYAPILDGKGFKHKVKSSFQPLYELYKKKKAVASVNAFLPFVDKFVFLSPSFQKQFEIFAHYHDEQKKLASISNPLVCSVEVSQKEFVNKENMVLLVGRMLEGQKRVTKAIKIWSEIEKDDCLKEWRFCVVGEGPDLPAYKQFANQLGLKRISFEGYQNPQPYYKRAKIFLMTSAFEGFGMTLVEAQQFGVVPIVMDSYLSLHDIIKDGVNGCIVPDDDMEGFVNCLKILMEDENMMNSLRCNGLTSITKFSVNNIVDMWNDLIINI